MRELARLVPDCVVLVRRLLGDRRVRRRTRWMLAGLAAYLAMPFDLVPDFVPVAGQLDDAVVVALVLGAIVRTAPPEIVAEHWPGTPRGLELLRAAPDPARLLADALRAVLLLGAVAMLVAGSGADAVGLGLFGITALAVRLVGASPRSDLLFVALLTAYGYLSALGAFDGLRDTDRVGHAVAAAAVTPLLIHAARRAGVLAPAAPRLGVWLVGGALGVALGAVWELVEVTVDATLGTDMSAGYADTIGDLVSDAVGALVAAGFVAARGAPAGTMAPMSHERATEAEEEYLQTLFWLHEARLPMTGANVARAMQLSPPTVHEMVGRLERDGYITRADDKSISFTDAGRARAEDIVRRHRLIERFLTDVLGIPWDEVHEEAERLEHAMSPVLEARMLAAIGDAKTCPHGHPIQAGSRIEGVPLADVELGASVTVLRFENEAEDLLHYLKDTGLEPGLEGTLDGSGDEDVVVLSGDGQRISVTRSVAETVSVLADPSPPPRVALPGQLVLGRERYGR